MMFTSLPKRRTQAKLGSRSVHSKFLVFSTSGPVSWDHGDVAGERCDVTISVGEKGSKESLGTRQRA